MKFMCIHSMPPKSMSLQQTRDFAQLTQRDPVVKGRRSVGNLTEGKIVCVLEAPNKQDVANFFRKNNMPFDSITEIEFEGEGGILTPVAQPATAGARP
jgi:hypothetical protein